MKKFLISAVSVAAAVTLLAGCSGQTSSPTAAKSGAAAKPDLITDGVLTVGTSPDFPPVTYLEGDKLVGSDVETIKEAAKRMGLKVKYVYQPWAQLINSVQTNRIDVAVSSLDDSVEKQKTVDFVDYFASGGEFYTTPALAKNYTKPTDICGTPIALSTNTQYYTQLQAMSKKVCTDAGLPPVKFIGTDAGAAARLQLDQGRAKLAVQAKENLAYFETQEPGKYKIVLDGLPPEVIAMVVNKNNPGLTAELDKVMKQMYDDGTTKKIVAKYGLEGAIAPAVNGVKN